MPDTTEYAIMGKYLNHAAGEIDTAEGDQGADYLIDEYRLAYGSGWSLWKKRIQ